MEMFKFALLFTVLLLSLGCSSTSESAKSSRSNYKVVHVGSGFTIEQGYKVLEDGWFVPKYRIKGQLLNMSNYKLIAQYNCGESKDVFDDVMMVAESGSSQYVYETEKVLSDWIGTKKHSMTKIQSKSCSKRPFKIWFANESQYPSAANDINESFGGNATQLVNTFDVIGSARIIGLYNPNKKEFVDWIVNTQGSQGSDVFKYHHPEYQTLQVMDWMILNDVYSVFVRDTDNTKYSRFSFYNVADGLTEKNWATHRFVFDGLGNRSHKFWYEGNDKTSLLYDEFFDNYAVDETKYHFSNISHYKELEFLARLNCLLSKYGPFDQWKLLPEKKECADATTLYSYMNRADAPVNLFNEDGRSLLMLSAFEGDTSLVSELLTRNADISAIDFNGNTVVHHAFPSPENAVGQNRKKLFELLLSKGASFTKANNDGLTPVRKYTLSRDQYLEKAKTDSTFEKNWQRMLESRRQGRIAQEVRNESLRKEIDDTNRIDLVEASNMGMNNFVLELSQEQERLERFQNGGLTNAELEQLRQQELMRQYSSNNSSVSNSSVSEVDKKTKKFEECPATFEHYEKTGEKTVLVEVKSGGVYCQ